MARVLPVGKARVSSPYQGGYRYQGGHSGTDYAVPMGTRVASAAGGTVVQAGWAGAYGYRVGVRHGDGVVTYYSHLSRIGVQVGQKVGAGQVVGNVGSTGNSSGPHLHFEVFVNGQMTNPEDWLMGAESMSPYGGQVDATTGQPVERVGVRITPVQPDSAYGENPNQVDLTAAESRFGYEAAESRFGFTAEEARSIQAGLSDEIVQPTDDEGEIIWKDAAPTGPVDTATGNVLEQRQIEQLAVQAGFTPEQAKIAAAIAMAESAGRVRAHNDIAPDDSYGLWQINLLYDQAERRRRLGLAGVGSPDGLYDPLSNARAAYALFKEQGWGAWSVYNNGRYRDNL